METFEEKERNELLRSVQLGRETIVYLQTDPIGKRLWHNAEAELVDVRNELETVDPNDKSAIMALQVRAGAARAFISTVGGIIQDGRNAEIELEQGED